MGKKLKVLVVDDSAFMRLLISDLLSDDPQIEVIDTAIHGKEAAEKVQSKNPDIVLLDLNMPDYDGLYAVKEIMRIKPTPILILSSVGNTNLQPVFEALKNGAVDYINKPSRNRAKMRELQQELIQKIKSTSRAKPHQVITRVDAPVEPSRIKRKKPYDLIVIGASTGGPTAIERVVVSLPENFDLPIVICQHMPATFIPQFVQRLDALTPLRVVIATEGMTPTPGVIMLCPGHANLILSLENNKTVVSFTDKKYTDYNYPSINSMMLSAVEIHKDKTVGVLLTGMGKDGVTGMKAINEYNGFTIGQDKASCVIYGMPKAAYEAGAVQKVLDIKEIGNYLLKEL